MDNAKTSAFTGQTLNRIIGVRIPNSSSSQLWDITIQHGKIAAIDAHDATAAKETGPGILEGGHRLIAPSLCHAHIHLDKCFLLQDPKYQHLQIETGDFSEAMELTSKAKSMFEEEDLLRRGRLLIEESIRFGVTAMRAFVEIDGVVKLACLHAGIKLKEEFKDRCYVQICAFAQLPVFSGNSMNHENMNMMLAAAKYEEVEVLGSTPYVEEDIMFQKLNVHWMTALALETNKHLDLHLDYHLEQDKEPFIWEALKNIEEMQWAKSTGGKRITFGHCTRLTRFQEEDWTRLKQEIGRLPLSFVGLPTSDLFMMRTSDNRRGTLPIVELIEKYGFDAAMAVNNVGNAFTPQGNCDPLQLASLGVGLYQAGTKKDTEIIYEAVSSRAKTAIGCDSTSLHLQPGQPADFVLFDSMESGWRCRKSIMEVVYDAGQVRQTIYQGRITASMGHS